MVLGVGDGDSGGPLVPDDASGVPGQDVEQAPAVLVEDVTALDGAGQGTAEVGEDRLHLLQAAVLHEERGGAEDLRGNERRVRSHGLGGGAQERDLRQVRTPAGAPGHGHSVAGGEVVERGRVGRGDAVAEHRAGRQRRQGREEGVGVGNEHDAGLGAELAGSEGEGGGEAGGDVLGAVGPARRGDDHRVGGTEFAVEGDGVGTVGGELEEVPAAVRGAGEADGLDAGVPYGVGSLALALDELEQVGRCSGGVQGRRGDGCGEPGEFGVAGVGLDDDGAAGREGTDGVAAQHTEREGEVARREDQDGAERHGGAADVGTGAHRPVRVGVVDADVVEGPGGEALGEEPALEGGAGEFTAEACLGQVRLPLGDGDEGVCGGVERVGDCGQQTGAVPGRDGAGGAGGGGRLGENRVQGRGGRGQGGAHGGTS